MVFLIDFKKKSKEEVRKLKKMLVEKGIKVWETKTVKKEQKKL